MKSISSIVSNNNINAQHFFHVFQPILNIHTMKLFGYECFIRSKYIEKTEDIFKHAKKLNKLNELDIVSVEKAIETYCDKFYHSYDQTLLFVNVFPSTIITKNFIEQLEEIVQVHNFNPHQLVLEINESEQIVNHVVMNEILTDIKKLGVKIALDDFGKGVDSLKNIVEFKLNFIKLDRYFASKLSTCTRKQQLLQNMLPFFHDNQIQIVLEGIECEEELNIAKLLEIHYGQGYLLGKPDI